MWESLLSNLEATDKITYPPHACRQLALYEAELGRLLPASYKEFCSVIGPGELPSNHRITAPGNRKDYFEARRAHEFGESVKNARLGADHLPRDSRDKFANALFFADDISTYHYFWNTAEVTVAEANEYAVYVLTRFPEVHRLSDTFSDFVTKSCLDLEGTGLDPEIGVGNKFRPATVMGNRPPRIAIPKAWRTSTVLALVNSMREDGTFDRMPILADALQDAGCNNEELLSHCRYPGGHVRGCWIVDLLGKK